VKQLLEMLPKLLSVMPELVKYIKYIPILMILAGIGYGIYYGMQNYKDPYLCYNNQLYEQKFISSNVYVFIGDVCVSGNENENKPAATEN